MNEKILELHAISKLITRPATTSEKLLVRSFISLGNKNKPGLFLIHGLSASPQTFNKLALEATKLDYSVSVPCLPGHGTTADKLINVSHKQWHKTVLSSYLELQEHCPKGVIGVGHSMGAALLIQLSMEHDNFKQLILLCPAIYPPIIIKYASPFLKLINKIGLNYIWQIAGDAKKPDAVILSYRRTAINALLEFLKTIKKAQQVISQVKIPTTIIAARYDSLIKKHHIKKIFDNLTIKNKKVVYLENSAHEATIDYNQDQIIKVVLSYLQKNKP
jgi:carboxylesterase